MVPVGLAPEPLQTGPLMQKVASPSTFTPVHPAGNVGYVVLVVAAVAAGAFVVAPGITGACVGTWVGVIGALVVGEPGVTGALVVGAGALVVGPGALVDGADVGTGRSHTQPHAPEVTFLHEDVTGAMHTLKPLLKLFALVKHCATATSPIVGQRVPEGAAFEPTHTGPLMQNVASPSTLTWEQPGVGALVVGAGVGAVVVGVGALVVDVGVTGAVVVEPGAGIGVLVVGVRVTGAVVAGAGVTGTAVTGVAIGALVVGVTGAAVGGARVIGAAVGGLGVTIDAGVGVTV